MHTSQGNHMSAFSVRRQLAIFQSAGSMLYGVCNANDDLAMRVAYGTIVGLMDSLHAIYVSGGIFLVTGGQR